MKLTKTYWNHKGTYQADLDRLAAKLVPKSGKATTTRGELLRCMQNAYHELWNNGFCNLDVQHRYYEVLYILQYRTEITAMMTDRNAFPRVERILAIMRERCNTDLPDVNDQDNDELDEGNYEVLIDDKFRSSFEKVADGIIRLVKKLDKKESTNVK